MLALEPLRSSGVSGTVKRPGLWARLSDAARGNPVPERPVVTRELPATAEAPREELATVLSCFGSPRVFPRGVRPEGKEIRGGGV